MAELQIPKISTNFFSSIVLFLVLPLSACGIDPAVPSGGIVDNGNRPKDRRSDGTTSDDAKTSPSDSPVPSSEQGSMIASTRLFDGKFLVDLPSGKWTQDKSASSAAVEIWGSDVGDRISFSSPEDTCTGSSVSVQSTGTTVTQCSPTLAYATTRNGKGVRVEHNLSTEKFDAIVKSLRDGPQE